MVYKAFVAQVALYLVRPRVGNNSDLLLDLRLHRYSTEVVALVKSL